MEVQKVENIIGFFWTLRLAQVLSLSKGSRFEIVLDQSPGPPEYRASWVSRCYSAELEGFNEGVMVVTSHHDNRIRHVLLKDIQRIYISDDTGSEYSLYRR